MQNRNFFLLIQLTFFSSIFLWAEPNNPFENLSISKAQENRETPFNQLSDAKPIPKEEVKVTVAPAIKNQPIKKVYDFNEISTKLKSQMVTNSTILKKIHDRTFLKRFYRQNNYMPLWITENGFDKKASSLFRAVENDITINKKSKIYQEYLYLIKYIKNKDRDRDQLQIELQLSQLYLDFLKHTLYGSINWKQFSLKLSALKKKRIYGNWVKNKAPYSLSELMLQPDIPATIKEITPKHFGYNGLLEALKKLKVLEEKGAWSQLPEFKRLALGDQGDNVLKLRERLEQSGDLKNCAENGEKLFESDKESDESLTFQPRASFDECLDTAVKKFQKRHGLEEDGIVGAGTRRAMNETIQSKIQKVLLNIDRIKWLPRELKERYLIVNIPEYMLHYVEDETTKDNIAVIVGDTKHPTPIFNENISYIVLNPYWKVPEGIVKREIVPAMVRDPNYLKKQGLEIHTTWSERSPKVSPYNLYWEDYYHGYEKFPYRIMQPPGKKNALGKIKFKFPNRFDVYLHDTPTKHLFKRTKRAFSHGCIRISQPHELFETISTFNDNIDLKKSKKVLKGKRQTQINISNKLPIHIVYLTAGFNAKTGDIEFRNDIYKYDKMQNMDKY
ncbi:MAG: L,D-transpeptidase family protein [Epsilonproteobacteria bacterium]|nr:L,D-transpeptidase family protein [Campylobacterota bacterium]